jgi:hypothetical protein
MRRSNTSLEYASFLIASSCIHFNCSSLVLKMGETVGASGRLNPSQFGLHWDCSSLSSVARASLSYVSHDSAILAAAYKSGFTWMPGLAVAGAGFAGVVGFAGADDGMLRLAMLAQDVIVSG